MVEYEICEIQNMSQGEFKPKFGVRCPSGEVINIGEDENRAAEIVKTLNNYAVCDCHIHDVIRDFLFERYNN